MVVILLTLSLCHLVTLSSCHVLSGASTISFPTLPQRCATFARGAAVPLLFAATLFVSAFLLFLVQPMIAQMILPLLGGTPAVWNTCMVFFQAVLLAGYVYAHVSARLLSQRRQIVLHLSVLLIALMVLPLQIPTGWVPPVRQN